MSSQIREAVLVLLLPTRYMLGNRKPPGGSSWVAAQGKLLDGPDQLYYPSCPWTF